MRGYYLKVNTCPRESKAHVVVKSSCKFGNNGFFFFGKDIYIYLYIYFVYPFFFFPFLIEAVREVGR